MKKWTTSYTRRTLGDLDDAFADYEAKATGLGDRFLKRFKKAMVLSETNPFLFGEVKTRIRAATVDRFPFVIYYRVESERVVVVAVRHGRDDPEIWKSRS